MHLTIKAFTADASGTRRPLPGREDARLTVKDFRQASWEVRDWCEDNEVREGQFVATLQDDGHHDVIGEVRLSGLVVGRKVDGETPVLFDPAKHPRRPQPPYEKVRISVPGVGRIEISGEGNHLHLRKAGGGGTPMEHMGSYNLDDDGAPIWDEHLRSVAPGQEAAVRDAVDDWAATLEAKLMLARNDMVAADEHGAALERRAYKLDCMAARIRAAQGPHDERRREAQRRLRELEEGIVPSGPTFGVDLHPGVSPCEAQATMPCIRPACMR